MYRWVHNAASTNPPAWRVTVSGGQCYLPHLQGLPSHSPGPLTACPGQARIRLNCDCQDKQVQPHVPQALCCYKTSQPGAGRCCADRAAFTNIGEGLGALGRQIVCWHRIAMEQVGTHLVLACMYCSLACSQAEAHRGCHAGQSRGEAAGLTLANPASKQANLLGWGTTFCNQQWDTPWTPICCTASTPGGAASVPEGAPSPCRLTPFTFMQLHSSLAI